MDELEIIITSDGSHTLRNKRLDETYHSIHGAVQESVHVFINHGLQYFHKLHDASQVSVLEVGFGTGLNALLSLQYARKSRVSVKYTTLEPFPLERHIWRDLNYLHEHREHFSALHNAPWHQETLIVPEFTLSKLKSSLDAIVFEESFDVVYFDAFAPSVQPELWVYDVLKKITETLKPGGLFVTYSAKGQLKRDLRTLGLNVETLPGPPGKLEMVRAIK